MQFSLQIVCTDDKFSKPVFLYRENSAINKLFESILEGNEYCKKMMKKYFNKNIVMSIEDEKTLNQVINARYVINCLLHEIIKYEIMII